MLRVVQVTNTGGFIPPMQLISLWLLIIAILFFIEIIMAISQLSDLIHGLGKRLDGLNLRNMRLLQFTKSSREVNFKLRHALIAFSLDGLKCSSRGTHSALSFLIYAQPWCTSWPRAPTNRDQSSHSLLWIASRCSST